MMMMMMVMKVLCVVQILYQTLTRLKMDLSGVQTVPSHSLSLCGVFGPTVTTR